MLNIQPMILSGKRMMLEPLDESHRDSLRSVAQDERIWTHNASMAFGSRFDQWFDKALQSSRTRQQIPFVIRRISDRAIFGSTRYYDISTEHHKLSIGYTWLVVDAWGTVVNPECKFLMLRHAFEILEVNRVELVTDVRNLRSRSAIKKLGAIEEGILRQHMVLESGHVRDSAVHSIIKSEWPSVKLHLMERLSGFL